GGGGGGGGGGGVGGGRGRGGGGGWGRQRERRRGRFPAHRPGDPVPLRLGQPDRVAERREGAVPALHPAARAAGPGQPVPPVLAGVPRDLAGGLARARDRRI